MGKSKLGLFSVLLVISVFWKPAYTNECSTACKGNPSTPGLAANTKYNYGVEGTVNVFLTGSSDKETSVKLLGQVSVTALGNCGHELSVQNLVISGPDGKKYQSPPGIDKPVRFSLQDGRLSAEICASEGDTRRSLNIKRAIISLLQTEQKSSTQVDIFGACPTESSYSAEGGATLVHRTRDLARCAHREQGNDLIASIVNENAEIKESQVLQSTLHVESKVNNGVPEKVSASEEYLYKPFSVGENGARAKVHTKLVLTGKSGGGAAAASCTIPRTIIFEAPHGAPLADNVDSALSAVKETARSIGKEASEKSAGAFASLIRIFRVTNKDDLIKIWNQVKGNNFEKRVYLDALLRTGTGPSIEASIQVLKSHALNELEQQLVYLSLGNAKHVNDEALKAATGLLDQQNLPKEIYLGVGALAGAYCRSHQCHTIKSDGIVALSQKLGAKLQNCKPKSKVDEDYVVAVLKGIRSIRHLEDSLIDKLVHCANDHSVKARVKAAVLEAFVSDPCSAKLKKTALDIMKNRQLDSEIRIKGYQAVIACPCGKSANEIKTLLESEPVHQVGRYITSSLRAIRASSSADRLLARQHYALIRTPNKFNVDDRKYSFYRESSFNVDALGIGGVVEQSVIYSQKSFLPRSASLNLTTEIFGHNFNILELGGRQGNLDLVVEHFLGPKGILNTKGPQAIYDILVQAFAQSSEKVKSALNRGRRSVKTEIDGFDKNLKAEELHFDNELDLDIYVKLFGTDAVFLSLGDDKGFDYNKVLDKIMDTITGGIGKAQHIKSTELRTHLLFLDAQLSYPTSVGLPLKLDLTGAATARVDLSTNFDLKQCINNPQNAKIDIKFVPSSDIEITGTLIVDADTVATGLKVVTNLHSSTGGHLVAKVLENGNGIDLQLGLPVEKQEILVASNELVYITVEKGQKEKQSKIAVDGERKEYSGCFDQLSGLLGMTLCGEVSLPFSVSGAEGQASISKYLARYPLTGPSRLKLVLEKNDLKGYHVRGLVRNEQGKTTLDLLFEAEGSKNRRTQIIAEKTYNDNEMGLKFALTSPIKVLGADITIRTSSSELTALAKAKLDNDQYYIKVGFNVAGNEQRTTYKPIFEYQVPGDEKHAVQIDGNVIKEVNGPVTKFKLEGITVKLPSSQDPVTIQGYFSNQANARNIAWQLISDFTTIKGSLKNNDLDLEFSNTLNPLVNFILKGHSEFGDVIKNEFDIVYSGDCKDKSRRVVLSQYLKYQLQNEKNYNVITKNKLEIITFPFKIEFDADVDPKKVEVEFQFKNVDQKADLELKARTQIKRPEDYSLKLNTNLNKHGLEIFSKRDVLSNDKSNLQNYVVVKGVGKYELSGVILHRTLPNDINVGANGHLKITGKKNEDIKFDFGAIQTTALYSSHAKVSSSQGELLDYSLKINTGANADGLLKFSLKDTITANGQFKVTDADGKGNGMVIVDFKKSQRKIKADIKFQAKKPVFNGDFLIFLNWEKDNNDKISFSTNTKQTENLLDSKNKLEYRGKATEVNVNMNGEYAVAGKCHANIEIVLPTERCLTFKFDRELQDKGGVYNGNANVLISDAPKRGAAASTISYEGKLVQTDVDKQIIDYKGQLDFKLKDGKHLQNTFVLKNQPQGDKFKFDFESKVTGNAFPKPASVVASVTYLDSLSALDYDYHMKAAYGDDTSADLTGKWIVKLQETGENKYLDDFTVNVRLPFEKAHDIKWVSTLLYLLPEKKDVAEYTIIESLHVNADVWKVDANGKIGGRSGAGTVKVLVPHADPVVLDANYKVDNSADKKALFTEVKARYGKGKSASFAVDTSGNANGNSVNIKVNAPQLDKMKKLEITVHSKHPAPDTYSSNWIIDADGRVYKSESSIVLSKAHPILDLKYTSPTNTKTSRIYVKGTSLSSTQGKVEVKIDNIRDISLDATSEASVQKDNVNFKVQANSNELGWKNFVGEIISKDSDNGKRLEFHSTNDNKNVLSGSTSFISKQEGQKTIIEGSGSVKIKEEQKSANFKYIRTLLTEGNEKGVETFFNVAFGERSYVAESRVTNLEYKNSHVYCEEKKQCAHAELQTKVDISKPGVISNVISAGLDLRTLGIAPELGLIVRDEVSTSSLPQYNLDLHANKDSKKYHLHIYSTPVFGHSKAGIKIQLPSRVMVLEQSVAYPTDKPLPFPIKGDLVLDLDKNKQGHKAAARFLVDLELDNADKQTAVAEFGFSHPKIDKEAVIRISGAAVRKGENSIKIETSAKIAHPCLGKDREAKILFEASPTHLTFLINTPLVKVIDITASAAIKDKLQKADVKFVLLEGKPVQAEFLVEDFQYYEFTTAEADRKLSVIGHIDPEKRVDISADIVLGGQKKNLAHGALWLEDNQVKSDYGASKDHCEYFYKALRKDLDDLEGRVKQLGEKASNDFKDVTRRVQPTLHKLEKAYEDDLKKIYKEFADDKVLKEISQAFYDIVQYFAKLIDTVVTETKPIIDSITAVYIDLAKKIQEAYEKQIEPSIKQIYNIIAEGLKNYLDVLIDVVAHGAAFVTDFFEKHKAELQELTNTIAEIFKDLTRLIVAELKEYRVKVEQIFAEFTQYLKDMPILQAIKEKWSELAVPEQTLALAQQAHDAIRPLLPTPEAQAFADAFNDYVIKKLRKEKVDDNKELRVVYQKLLTALASLAQHVRAQLSQYGVVPAAPQLTSWWNWSPVNAGSAPALGGSASFSLIRQILTGDFPDVTAVIKAYRPRSLNPLEQIPSNLRAVVVNGQHIFTFDGRHLTFPGSCRYVLAHDYIDRNFTLLMQMADGKPKALVLEDKNGNVIELKDNGQATLNGANHGYPIEEKDSFAFRQANGRVGLGTLYGIMAFCSAKLEVCYIDVNGFYLGKLRGLLGDGNNEPYDDFRLPNGKISTSESEFGNAYRLARSCPQVQGPQHSHHQLHHAALPEACEKVFGGISPLKPLSFVLDIAPFRQACIHAVAGDSANALTQACELGAGYAALALSGLLPAVLPDVCLRCSDADKPRTIGDTYEFKLPNKQADIVIAVETTKVNEKTFKELVVPLVGQIVDQLKGKHCGDIKVYLVGITSRFPYPIFYDTDPKLKNAKITFSDESRYNWVAPIKTGQPRVDEAIEKFVSILNGFKSYFGIMNIEGAYAQLSEIPLRPAAVKHVITVVGENCLPTDILMTAVTAGLHDAISENNAITHSLVSVAEDLVIGNGKNAQHVVGFNKNSVLMLGEKRPSKDAAALRATLERKSDSCIDFIEDVEGLVFSGSNFQALSPPQQKQFIQTASSAIEHAMLHESLLQECTCTYGDALTARSVCINKERKETARRRK